MQGSIPQTYTISDFIEWHNRKQLRLDPSFQRGAVWNPVAKAFLIDSILNKLPVPQIYLRTRIDAVSQKTVREVVDGQQRLRTILEFAQGALRTSTKSQNFPSVRYEDLPAEDQQAFLSYPLTTVQLINASDADVLEVFARLNSYSVKVTPAELRHAKYDEPVKWAIWYATREWNVLWEKFNVVSVRDSVRLKNTSFMAELFMTADAGLGDGGEPVINKYYQLNRSRDDDYFLDIRSKVNFGVEYIINNFSESMSDSTFFDSPNFLILFNAVLFLHGVNPLGRASREIEGLRGAGVNLATAVGRLQEIQSAIENDDIEGPFARFIAASKSSTQRVSSRTVRNDFVIRALV
ncbi:DUF262 domain-containing protein [Brucella intermedia]|uniref:DUF262 domain-containing protein n=1 Tax=Brucella intermedia TaxID=94625 RepID=UPI00224A7F52|nr:DUF262 domain-containing protein [Brucella intermedia]